MPELPSRAIRLRLAGPSAEEFLRLVQEYEDYGAVVGLTREQTYAVVDRMPDPADRRQVKDALLAASFVAKREGGKESDDA